MAISKKVKEQVGIKFNGLCAYTGKPLDDGWQVDHKVSKNCFQKYLHKDHYYKHTEREEQITVEEYLDLSNKKRWDIMSFYRYIPKDIRPIKECDDISNLVPAIKIVNHYKREKDLEGFRKYMMNFHLRLAKLPKRTQVESTKKRIEYMNTIAALFDITPDKPFSGKFYFETLTGT